MPVEQREGALLAGRFRLERRLGEGGMGIVWAATNTVTGRRVAIKMLRDSSTEDPHVRRRFLREGRAASKVQHPNVVEILDVLELEEQTPAIVMELLEGESLGQRIRRERAIPLTEVAAIMLPAVAAVGAAHAHGVVHRDLKPDNIFVAHGHEPGERVVKVLDFGIAKITAEGEGGQTGNMTGTGAMLGTPYYMAPEQLFSDETLDYRCDIWALGVILYECLAGRRPTQGDNFADIVKVIATQKITPFRQAAPDVPLEIGELVERMLAFDKEKRPQSLREVRDVLRHYTDVMASTFGEPVLKPMKQSRDADASGETSGLRREDVALLLDEPASQPDTGPSTAATLDAPASLRKLKVELAETGAADTQGGLGLGVSTPPRAVKRRATAFYVAVAAAVTVTVLGGVAMQAMRVVRAPPASAAAAPGSEATSTAAPSAPVTLATTMPAAPPTTATAATATATATATAAMAVGPGTATTSAAPTHERATAKPGGAAAAETPAGAASRPSATGTATAAAASTNRGDATTPRAAAEATGAPGGLVEKPPF